MPAAMTLYDVAKEGLLIQEILEESLGELTPELEARIDELLTVGPDRVEAAVMVVRQLDASCDACNDESRRLADRAKSYANQSKALRQRIAIACDAAFNGKVKTDRFTVWTQKSPDGVAFELKPDTDMEALYREIPEAVSAKYTLRLSALKALLDAGAILPPQIEVLSYEGLRSLRIK